MSHVYNLSEPTQLSKIWKVVAYKSVTSPKERDYTCISILLNTIQYLSLIHVFLSELDISRFYYLPNWKLQGFSRRR